MKRKFWWSVAIFGILVFVAFVVVMIVGFWTMFSGAKIYDDGYYKYQVSDGKIYIRGLTESGKQQKILVIPKEIKGSKVSCLGGFTKNPFAFNWHDFSADFKSDKLEKIFIPFSINMSDDLEYLENTKKVIYMGERFISFGYPYYYYHLECFYSKRYIDGYPLLERDEIKIANVTFSYNYDTEKDYWIDDIGYNSMIEYVPENPQREGYVFDGWYKESNCINKWNFDMDKTPEIQYDEENKVVYQETILYAKWTK